MGTTLHTLAPAKGATKNKKRLGRGRGSGTGKTSGKGVKGTKARAGHHGPRRGFEGGQMPMKMRIAKRGFKNPFRVEAHPINLRTLEDLFEAGATVDLDAMRGRGLLPKRVDVVKILAEGELTKALHVSAHRFSAAARAKIEQAGGSATTLEAPAADAAGVDNPDAAQ